MQNKGGFFGHGEDEVFCLIIGWILFIFGLMVFPIAGVVWLAALGLLIAGIGFWVLVEAFIFYEVPRLMELRLMIKEGSWTQLLAQL